MILTVPDLLRGIAFGFGAIVIGFAVLTLAAMAVDFRGRWKAGHDRLEYLERFYDECRSLSLTITRDSMTLAGPLTLESWVYMLRYGGLADGAGGSLVHLNFPVSGAGVYPYPWPTGIDLWVQRVDPDGHRLPHFTDDGGCQCTCPRCVTEWERDDYYVEAGVFGLSAEFGAWKRRCRCPACSEHCPGVGRLDRTVLP